MGGQVYEFSYQNKTIAVGSGSGDIIIFNTITGSETAVLSGHTGPVQSVTYSPDGISLASGSWDNTVKLWDVQTGGVVKTFYGHTSIVYSVSVSADCTRIASGSRDHTIRLWDIQTGECHCVINQEDRVEHVSFFPTDPQHLLSICEDKVRQWDIDGHQIGHAYDGSHVAFSSDGTQSVSCYRGVVKVQNPSSGVIVTEFQIDDGVFYRCCFSPDSRLIAVACDNTAYVWDITSSTPNLIETFVGHTQEINSLLRTQHITSLVFSSPSSLISTSEDGSIKFWQIGSSLKDPLGAPKSISLTLDNIRSITLQAKDGIIITSDSDGVVRTWDTFTGLCKASFQTPVKYDDKRDAQLINGKLILCWCAYEEINIWDTEKEELLLKIDKPNEFWNLKISDDGSRVFCLAGEFIHAWSIWTGERVGMVKAGDDISLPLTVDSSKVWAWNYSEGYYKGWDFGTPGLSPIQLPRTTPYRLHPNGTILWRNHLLRIEDTRIGKVAFQLPKRYGRPRGVGWNGQYLVACFSPTEVLILDFSHILK